MGYSPLAKGKKMDDETLNKMAARYNKTMPQLMIRWSVQMGYITIPKSSKTERIVENAEVFDWAITEEDMKVLEGLETFNCVGPGWDPTTSSWENLK